MPHSNVLNALTSCVLNTVKSFGSNITPKAKGLGGFFMLFVFFVLFFGQRWDTA